MANRVIIVGANRRGEQIPIGELRQMAGRAGRGHEQGSCYADLVVEECDSEYVEDNLDSKAELNVQSVLDNADLLAFHVMSEICRETVFDEETFENWFARSFHAFCGGKVKWDKVVKALHEAHAVRVSDGVVKATPIGEIAASYYFYPADVEAWRENFSTVFDLGVENDDVAVAWALGNVEFNRRSGDFGNRYEVMEECRNRLPAELEMQKGCLVTTTLWWYVFGGPPVGKMRNQAIELREDLGRIHRVLVELDKRAAKWNMEDFFNELLFRSRRAIPAELSSLFRVPGMTKGKAVALHEMGITTPRELARAKTTMDLEEVLGGGCEIP
jgi:hypothetical protein